MKAYYEKYWQGTLDKKDALYADPPTWPEKETSRLLKAMGGRIFGKVLDVGCGDGTFTNILSKYDPNLRLFGIDIAQTAITLAKDKHRLGLEFLVGDVISLPYRDRSFDCVILIEVLEHVFDIPGLLSEINRVMKRDGLLFITTTDFNWLKKLIISLFWFDRYFHPTNPHIRIFTRKTLKRLMRARGFTRIDYQWNGSYWGLMPMGQIAVGKKEFDGD